MKVLVAPHSHQYVVLLVSLDFTYSKCVVTRTQFSVPWWIMMLSILLLIIYVSILFHELLVQCSRPFFCGLFLYCLIGTFYLLWIINFCKILKVFSPVCSFLSLLLGSFDEQRFLIMSHLLFFSRKLVAYLKVIDILLSFLSCIHTPNQNNFLYVM